MNPVRADDRVGRALRAVAEHERRTLDAAHVPAELGHAVRERVGQHLQQLRAVDGEVRRSVARLTIASRSGSIVGIMLRRRGTSRSAGAGITGT